MAFYPGIDFGLKEKQKSMTHLSGFDKIPGCVADEDGGIK